MLTGRTETRTPQPLRFRVGPVALIAKSSRSPCEQRLRECVGPALSTPLYDVVEFTRAGNCHLSAAGETVFVIVDTKT